MADVRAIWSHEQLRDPHQVIDKAQRVRQMFAAIAPSYDLNNRLHSLGRDQAWRRAAVGMAQIRGSDVVLDVACGTGDVAMAFGRCRPQRVLGIDFTMAMLQLACHKARRWSGKLSYQCGDATALPIADRSVDVVSIAFGIRNIADPSLALAQFHRVLRPGGRLIILEFGQPATPLLRQVYDFYFQRILPRTAALIARDRSGAYRYLPQSVNTFIDRPTMLSRMRQAGFSQLQSRRLTLGVAILYRGERLV